MYQTQQRIFEQENDIKTVVIKGINEWNNKNNYSPITDLSIYAVPLIRYAIEDWMNEYSQSKDQYPNTSFSTYVKDEEPNLVFQFKWSLTHKAETLYRQAHNVLWLALTKEEQDGFLYGLRYLIQQTN